MEKVKSVAKPRMNRHPHTLVQDFNTGKEVIVADSHVLTEHKVFTDVRWQSTSAVPTTLFANGTAYVDINIEAYRAVCHSLMLEIRLTESGGSNSVTPCPAPLMIQRIEFAGNNGSDLIQTIYGENLFFNLAHLTQEELSQVAAVNNMNTSFAGPSAIAASGSARYYVPLLGSFIEQGQGLYLGGLKSPIRCRIYARASVESGSGTLNTAGLILHGSMEELPGQDLDDLDHEYANNVVEKPFLDIQNWSVSQTFAPSTAYTFQLQSIIGEVPYMLVGFRSSTAATNGGTRTFSALGNTATVEYLDVNGQNQQGGSALDYGQLRYLEAPKNWVGSMFASLPLIPIIFGEPTAAVLRGEKKGYRYNDTHDQLKLTTDSAWSSATYTLDCWAPAWRKLQIDHGRIVPLK